MKHKLLLLGCLFAVISIQAQETQKKETISVNFSEFNPGTQYADNEQHNLGKGLVIYTTDCHFTTELRIYSSSTYNGYVISDPLPGKITQMTFNMGHSKEETLNIYGRINNNDWELIKGIKTNSTSYENYTLNIPTNKVYTQFKLDVAGENQIRIKSMSITYIIEIDKPTLSTSHTFTESMNVEITNNTDGATIYYTTDGSNPSVDNGNVYTSPFTIKETTTVKAVAVKEGKSSGIAEATYTKIVPKCALPVINPQGGDTPESALRILQNSIITITPAEYNTITYRINEGETITATETISFSVEELGNMALIVTSVCGKDRRDAIYYYKIIMHENITATLTKEDIQNATDRSYDKNNIVNSTCGVWGGYMRINEASLQFNCESDYHIQSPEFPGKVVSVSVTFTPGTSSTSARGIVIMPSNYKDTQPNSTTKGNLGTISYVGQENPTSTTTLTDDVTSFKLYATGGAIYLSQIEVVYEKPADYILNVGSTGWSTLYLGLDAIIPDGVTCYTVSTVANDIVTLTPITTGTLPAHTGVIINATANTQYTFSYKNSYGGSEGINNSLKGTLSKEYIPGGGYVLSIKDGTVGFYKAEEKDNGTFLNNANKAYLPASAVPASLQSNGLRFKIDDTANIEYQDTIHNYDCQSTIIYDLMGRRVEHMTKGIYIVNGRKIIIP